MIGVENEMNISPDGVTVRFYTESEEIFMAEKTGAKPNTVQIIDANEKRQLKESEPEKIIIQFQQALFIRTITHVYVSEMVLGKYLAIFSWTNVKHHHDISVPSNYDTCAHTMSLDEGEPPIDIDTPYITIPITGSILADLNWYRGKDTYSEFISKMLKAHITPAHCHPPAWTIGR